LTILVFIAVRYLLLKSELDTQKSFEFSNLITVEELNFPLNIFIGEILGLLVVYAFLKKTKSKE